MDRSQKSSKKICIVCYRSPQNILVLACDHTVCLQCTYKIMTNRNQSPDGNEIQFQCEKCHQVTYFDKDLIKQIEMSLYPVKKQSKPIDYERPCINDRTYEGDSFIDKMRKQYFSQNPSPHHSIKVIDKPIDRSKLLTQNNFLNSHSQSQPFYPPKCKIQSLQSFQNQLQLSFNKKTKKSEQKTPLRNTKTSKQTRCKSHSYYQLIYFCLECRQVVCSQCLLRGQHREHQNQSISQILSKQLPQFINRTSERFLTQVNKLENQKQKEFEELHQRLRQIKQIRHNAAQYFVQVRRNIQKQQDQVLIKCDQLLLNLKKEEHQNQSRQKELEIMLAKFIEEIKSLKAFYKQFSDKSNSDSQRKGIEKSLIQKYLSCQKSIKGFLEKDILPKDSQSMHHFSKQILDQSLSQRSSHFKNESFLLNQRIQQGISSIRQSLVFQSFSRSNTKLIKQTRKQAQTQSQSRMTTKVDLKLQQMHLTQKLKENNYISYMSTQNSQAKSKQILKKRMNEKSVQISPYKGSLLRQNNLQRNSVLPLRKQTIKNIDSIGKQNIRLQEKSFFHEKQVFNQTKNAIGLESSIKKHQNQKTNHIKFNQGSRSKSKNNSMTKSKKRCPMSSQNNIINKFKV